MDAGHRAPEHQRVDVVRAFIGVDGLEIVHHPHHVEFVGDAVGAVQVARRARDLERLAAIVALEQRDRRRRGFAGFQQPAQPQRALQAERDLGLHVGQFLLHQLIGGERAAELLAVERILPRGMPAEFRRAHGAPDNAEAGAVKAGEGTGEASGIGQQIVLRHHHIVQRDPAGGAGAHGKLAGDLRRFKTLRAALDDKAADLAVELGPDDGDVGDRGIGDPGLGAAQLKSTCRLFSPASSSSRDRSRGRAR